MQSGSDSIFRKLTRLHWPSFFIMMALCTFGLFFIYSTTYINDFIVLRNSTQQQAVWIGLGLVVYFFLALTDYRIYIRYGFYFFAAALVLMIITVFVARPINGARSWLILGPIRLQPAELVKLGYLCALTHFLLKMRDRIKSFLAVFLTFLLAMVPFGVISRAPDLGSSLVFIPSTLCALFAAGARKRYFILPAIAVTFISIVGYTYIYKMNKDLPGLKPYQNNRIRIFFDPSVDPRGAGWTITQSLIAVGSGGLTGKGYLKGEQNVNGFLPKNITYTDFIFSVICEETGFLGGASVIILEGLLLLSIVYIGSRVDYAGCIFAAAFLGMLFTHYFINAGMTIKVVPITGIPLPFVSYGGTFLLVCMAAFGILQSIWINRKSGLKL
jgi:rod shape determining protein RodA